MTMPPSGVEGIMDEQAMIEAEIQFELDNININDDVGHVDAEEEIPLPEENQPVAVELPVPEELDEYIRRIQEQSNAFEQQLLECDELLEHSSKKTENHSSALVPYDEEQLLMQLAKEHGCDPDQYRQQILMELENDDNIMDEDLADLISTGTGEQPEGQLAITDGVSTTDGALAADGALVVQIEKAVEEGVPGGEIVPVSQELVAVNTSEAQIDMQKMLKEQLHQLEKRYEDRLDKIKKDEAFKRNEDMVRQQRVAEERQWKLQEIQKEEHKLSVNKHMADKQMERVQDEFDKEMQERLTKFQKEMADLERETELQRKEHELAMEMERDRQQHKQHKAVLDIQRTYRGYRVRKEMNPVLQEKQEVRKKNNEERRIKEVQVEIDKREEDKKIKEEEERNRKEEAARQAEELKQAKAEEKKRIEEEKKRKKEEEERIKQEEKKRKEEEKQRKKEEERKKKEEEKLRKEEEKRRKDEEKQRKEEDKRRKQEEEKQRKEEEKQQKEEEKRRKQEEDRLKKEGEKLKQEDDEKQNSEERNSINEGEVKEDKQEKEKLDIEKTMKSDAEHLGKDDVKGETVQVAASGENNRNIAEGNEKNEKIMNSIGLTQQSVDAEIKGGRTQQSVDAEIKGGRTQQSVDAEIKGGRTQQSVDAEIKGGRTQQSVDAEIKGSETKGETNATTLKMSETTKAVTSVMSNELAAKDVGKPEETTAKLPSKSVVEASAMVPSRPKTPKTSTSTPRTSRIVTTPRTITAASKDMTVNKRQSGAVKEGSSSAAANALCLPDKLEILRMKFIKECHPWSKVSNEPWKLKAGISRKPLRRPSSAKKLPPLPDDKIIQAARVASLKQVTTVQLSDLPGNNVSSLGQCWGLKYLTLNNCNLIDLHGLSPCKQLQYIDVQKNRLEYIDLKDLGQLQYVNLAHNRLSSIHGLDNCTNIRWLDLSHNSITKLGGLDTLRRLHTLKIHHNQLISCQGLGATPTLQMLDMSHNYLQYIEDIEKLCLLLYLDVSSNNLLQIPELSNHVLLLELLVSDNSLSMVNNLAAVWLPLLGVVNLEQNSIGSLPCLQNCLLLRDFNIAYNQIIDKDTVEKCVKECHNLQNIDLEENPVIIDMDQSFYDKLRGFCPRLVCSNSDLSTKPAVMKPRTNFEAMCLTQSQTLRDVMSQFDNIVKSQVGGSTKNMDQAQICDLHFKFCERTFNIAVEQRSAHEYGEITITIPTAPSAPKSGRLLSARQKIMNPKEMFENALNSSSDVTNRKPASSIPPTDQDIQNFTASSNPKDLFQNALNSSASSSSALANKQNNATSVYGKPGTQRIEHQTHGSQGLENHGASGKDLFEQALMAASKPVVAGASSTSRANGVKPAQQTLVNGRSQSVHKSGDKRVAAAVTIQAVWRGYWTRKQIFLSLQNPFADFDPRLLQHLNKSAVKIQACWKGYILRKKLLAALEFAQCDFSDDEEDGDAMNFTGEGEFDLDKFVNFDQDLLDDEWKPPETPVIPDHYAVLKKPPMGKPPMPQLPLNDLRTPGKPMRAWRNDGSPMLDLSGRLNYRPTSSLASTELTVRSNSSKKEDKLSEEWGFKNTNTAHMMMERAKKMKYNAERRKKIRKLDPKQRLALFRKLEEVTQPQTHTIQQRKTLPRKEYFQARQDEIEREDQEKTQLFHARANRTFEWLHTQVGDHQTSDSVINKGFTEGPKYITPEKYLPELMSGKKVQLVSSPMSIELQSVDSVSNSGHHSAGQYQHRRFSGSAGSGSAGSSKLPPIQSTSSAPASHQMERMSFRNPKVNQSVGWGGGKKRNK